MEERQTCDASHPSWQGRLWLRDGIFLLRIHQLRKIYKNISTADLLQAAVSRAKRAGITREVSSSCMDDCYQEVTSFLNIALPPDMDDILDLDASMEGESSTIGSCLQGMNGEE